MEEEVVDAELAELERKIPVVKISKPIPTPSFSIFLAAVLDHWTPMGLLQLVESSTGPRFSLLRFRWKEKLSNWLQ